MMWIINFYYYSDYSYIFRIAKGFGLNLRIWTMFMYFTMCRSILNGKFENHVSYHIFIGNMMIISTIGHTISHILYNKNMMDSIHITGYILSFLFSMITFTYLLKKYNYKIFKLGHMVYYIFLLLCILHVKKYWYFFSTPLLVFIIESTLNYNKLQISKIINVKIIENISNDEIRENISIQNDLKIKNNKRKEVSNPVLYISLPRKIDSVPGSFYYICIPKLSIFEWHPFSISVSSFVDQLVFLIEVKGDWTSGLYDLTKTGIINDKIEDISVLVMGPFYTSSTKMLKTDVKEKIAICTGIGITPFLSIIGTKIDSYNVNLEHRDNFYNIFGKDFQQHRAYSLTSQKDIESCVTYKNQIFTIIWIFRNLINVQNLFECVKVIMENSVNIILKIYITSKDYNEELKNKFIEDNKVSGIEISFGRPSIEEIFKENPKSVFYCGNPLMKNLVNDYCYDNKIKFSSEIFG